MKNATVVDHLGNIVSVGSLVISDNGRGPHSGIVEDIGDKRIRIRASGSYRYYQPDTWFFSSPACGWVIAPGSHRNSRKAVPFDVIQKGEVVACVKAKSKGSAMENAVRGGVTGCFSVARSILK